MHFARSSVALAAAGLLLAGVPGPGTATDAAALALQAQDAGIDVLQLRPNFYMIAGVGANIAVQVGDDGVVVVDTGTADHAGAVVAAIRRITTRPIRYIINTSSGLDHVGGNATLARAGETLFIPGGPGLPVVDILGGGASIVAAEQVLARISEQTGPNALPEMGWPTETLNADQPRRYMYLNGEGIEILLQPPAHTDGDAIVFFRRSDVVVAGDVLDTTRFPVIDVERGGNVQGTIEVLSRLVDMAIPSVPIISREEGTLVVPGHGRVTDQLDIVEYRDMITIVRDRVQALIESGLTLEQVKAASPARGYTGRYGASSGPWTTDDFVEAVYRSLAQERR